jgi:hypothetical protein
MDGEKPLGNRSQLFNTMQRLSDASLRTADQICLYSPKEQH